MTAMNKALRDDAARRDAISVHDRSILVEAGAGSGKTAVMAGRIAAMLAEGVAPDSIAAASSRGDSSGSSSARSMIWPRTLFGIRFHTRSGRDR
jgi:hypothetical protein